jgi:hypothetical protein
MRGALPSEQAGLRLPNGIGDAVVDLILDRTVSCPSTGHRPAPLQLAGTYHRRAAAVPSSLNAG